MVLRDDGEVKSVNAKSKCKSMPTLENASDVKYVVNDESLIIKKSLNVYVNEEYVEQQRDNIFHTRFHIKIKYVVWLLIVVIVLILLAQLCLESSTWLLLSMLHRISFNSWINTEKLG